MDFSWDVDYNVAPPVSRIVAGAGGFVGFDDTDIFYSEDCLTWGVVAAGVGSPGKCVWSGDAFYAIVYDDPNYKVYRSTDGLSWSLVATGGYVSIDSAAAGYVYAYVGALGSIARSTDGVNWVAVPLTDGDENEVTGVVYLDGVFMSNNGRSRSTDGINFVDNGSSARLVFASESRGEFIRIKSDYTAEKSTDGASWTPMGAGTLSVGGVRMAATGLGFSLLQTDNGGGETTYRLYGLADDSDTFVDMHPDWENPEPPPNIGGEETLFSNGLFIINDYNGGDRRLVRVILGSVPVVLFWTNFFGQREE